MIRIAITCFLLAGCTGSPLFTSPSSSTHGVQQPVDNPEIHRGTLTGQKSSPDSGQSPAGDGTGGTGGRGGQGR